MDMSMRERIIITNLEEMLTTSRNEVIKIVTKLLQISHCLVECFSDV